MKRTWIIAAAVVALIAGAATFGYASIPDSGGVIHGCRKNSDGSVRVIDSDAGQTCQSGWTPLNWSQTGPQGPAGPPGLAGVHVVTGSTPGDASTTVLCPTGETALGVAQADAGVVGFAFSTTPVLGDDEVTPVGYFVDTNTATTIYVTCAVTN